MRNLRTRLALWIAPWLAKPVTYTFPTVYTGTTTVPMTLYSQTTTLPYYPNF